MVRMSINTSDLVKDVERTKLSLPSEKDIEKALSKGAEKTARQFADRCNELAPRSDADEYDRQYGDNPPSVKLSNSFVARPTGRSTASFEVISLDDERAYWLEIGTSGATGITPDDGLVMAIYAPNHPDANEDGRIFRDYIAETSGIEGRKYIEQAFQEFRSDNKLQRNVEEELDKIL